MRVNTWQNAEKVNGKNKPRGVCPQKGNKTMNNPRKKTLYSIYNDLIEFRERIREAQQEEEEERDNISENLQGSESYEEAAATCESLECVVSLLEEALAIIESAAE